MSYIYLGERNFFFFAQVFVPFNGMGNVLKITHSRLNIFLCFRIFFIFPCVKKKISFTIFFLLAEIKPQNINEIKLIFFVSFLNYLCFFFNCFHFHEMEIFCIRCEHIQWNNSVMMRFVMLTSDFRNFQFMVKLMNPFAEF